MVSREPDTVDLEEPLLSGDGSMAMENPSNDGGDHAEDDSSEIPPPPPFLGLVFLRVLFFFNGLSSSTWGRFAVIYYDQVKHLSPSQIGLIQGVQKIIGFPSQPLWGVVADCFQSRKQVYLFTKTISTCFLMSLAFVDDNFYNIFGCVLGMAVFKSAGVVDAYAVDFLGKAHKGLYGSIRLWTAVSWGVGAVAMGHITDSYGFNFNFYLYGGMSGALLFFITWGFPARSKSEQELYERRAAGDSEERRGPRPEELWNALTRPSVLFWLLEVAILGAAMATVETFLFVYLQNELNTSTVLCGYTVGITVIFELPLFAFSKSVLKNAGHDILFLMALFAYFLRSFGYSFLTESSSSYVLLLETMHGITFACMWIASVDFAAVVSPEEWATTIQTLLTAVLWCLGAGTGPILGGWVVERFGFVMLWRSAAGIVAGVTVVHIIMMLCGRGHDAFLGRLEAERRNRLQGPPVVEYLDVNREPLLARDVAPFPTDEDESACQAA